MAYILATPDAAAKALGLFGIMRTVGLTLATAITIKIASFVDAHTLSMMGGQLSGSVQSQGSQAGEMAKIEGSAGAVKGPVVAESTMANAAKYDTSERAQAAATEEMTHTGTSLGEVSSLGGGNMSAAADRMSSSNVARRAGDVNRTEGMGGWEHAGMKGRQEGEQSWGGAMQDQKMAEALGVNQQELGEFRQHGVVTEGMAPAIGKTLGMDSEQSRQLLTGMQVNPHDLTVNQDSGGLMLTHGRLQTADGATSLGEGMVTHSRTMTGSQLMDKADQLDKQGHHEAAAGMRGLVGRNVKSSDGKHHGMAAHGRGLLDNESAAYMEKQSYDGKTATVGVQHGSDVSWYDTTSDRQGRTVRHGNDIKIGNDLRKGDTVREGNDLTKGDHTRIGDTSDEGDHTTLGNTVTLNDGTHIDGQSAAQMALNGKPQLVSQTTNPKLSQNERDTQNLAVAAAVSDGMGSLISRTGISEDHSSVDGSIGAHIPGTKIGGQVAAGARSSDQYSSRLMAQHYNEVLKSADQEAAGKGLNRGDTNVMKAQRLQSAVQEEKKYFEEHGKWSYGASAAAGRVANALKPERLDVSKSGVDGISGNPSLSGEQRGAAHTADQVQNTVRTEQSSGPERSESRSHQGAVPLDRAARIDEPGQHREVATRSESASRDEASHVDHSSHVERHEGTHTTDHVQTADRTEQSSGPERSESRSHQDGARSDSAEPSGKPGHHQEAAAGLEHGNDDAGRHGDPSHGVERVGSNVTDQVQTADRTERNNGPEHPESRSHQGAVPLDRAARIDEPGQHREVATRSESASRDEASHVDHSGHVERHEGTHTTDHVQTADRTEQSSGPERSESRSHQGAVPVR